MFVWDLKIVYFEVTNENIDRSIEWDQRVSVEISFDCCRERWCIQYDNMSHFSMIIFQPYFVENGQTYT